MRRDTGTDHIVADGNAFKCLRCGDRYTMNLPCPISVYIAAVNAYVDIHKGCRKPEQKGSEQ